MTYVIIGIVTAYLLFSGWVWYVLAFDWLDEPAGSEDLWK